LNDSFLRNLQLLILMSSLI